MKLNKLEKGILIAVSALALATGIASADIGETYQQSVARFGQPNNVTDDGAIRWVLDHDHTVLARFTKNRCDFIEYNDFSGRVPDDILTKISQNVDIGDFYQEIKVPVGRFWITKSGSVSACLTVEDNHGKGRNPISLVIATREAIDAEQASNAKPAPTPVTAPTPALSMFEKVSVGELVRNSNVS